MDLKLIHQKSGSESFIEMSCRILSKCLLSYTELNNDFSLNTFLLCIVRITVTDYTFYINNDFGPHQMRQLSAGNKISPMFERSRLFFIYFY